MQAVDHKEGPGASAVNKPESDSDSDYSDSDEDESEGNKIVVAQKLCDEYKDELKRSLRALKKSRIP